MSTKTEFETKVAITDGFYNSARIRSGETFTAPVKEKSKWFRAADEADVTDDLGGEPALLKKSARDIVTSLAGLNDQELNGLIAAEQAGQARKGVLAAIGDELTNRVGRTGGPDPKAKQPDEKDPKVPGEGPADELLK